MKVRWIDRLIDRIDGYDEFIMFYLNLCISFCDVLLKNF